MRWRALQSKKFTDIIVRATMEVGSDTLRRIQPGDVAIQRGQTMLMENGLVRMQIEPDGGWVTVHARNIQGPTFLEEADAPSPQRQPAAADVRLQQPKSPPQQPKAQPPPPAEPRRSSPPPNTKGKGEGRDEYGGSKGKGEGKNDAREDYYANKGDRTGKGASEPTKGDTKGEQRWQVKAGPPPKAKSSMPIGAAPWQDGEDPWSKNAFDPWAKAADPWASGAKGTGKDTPQPARGAQARAPTRQDKSLGQPPAPSTPESTIRYDRMDMIRCRGLLLDNNRISVKPESVANLRTLKIPNMEAPDRRVKRTERGDRDRERPSRDDRDRDRDREGGRERRRDAAAAAAEEGAGGGSFLRDRGDALAEARRTPLQKETPKEKTPDAPLAGADKASTEKDASPEKPKEPEKKGNCPTQ